jgi:hypothetical protein
MYTRTIIIVFKNQDEDIEGIFVHNVYKGRQIVSGGINWAKFGQHFKLESCESEDSIDDCYIWTKINPKSW